MIDASNAMRLPLVLILLTQCSRQPLRIGPVNAGAEDNSYGSGETATGGVERPSAEVRVPSCQLTVDHSSITKGESILLTLAIGGTVHSRVIDGTAVENLAPTVTRVPSESKTFTATVAGEGGTATCFVAVQVRAYCVTLFEHIDYLGNSKEYGEGDVLAVGSSWNDLASSVKVSEGCSVTLYEHTRDGSYNGTTDGGASLVFKVNDATLVNNNFNDVVSALTCACD